jgi:homocysteine S-methyltransferase
VRQALGEQDKPLWLSFTLQDEDVDSVARLRSGETVSAAVAEAIRWARRPCCSIAASPR